VLPRTGATQINQYQIKERPTRQENNKGATLINQEEHKERPTPQENNKNHHQQTKIKPGKDESKITNKKPKNPGGTDQQPHRAAAHHEQHPAQPGTPTPPPDRAHPL
jgi:hypothetical protein